eukprot:4808109-Pyramimonas_sp.AAC.1
MAFLGFSPMSQSGASILGVVAFWFAPCTLFSGWHRVKAIIALVGHRYSRLQQHIERPRSAWGLSSGGKGLSKGPQVDDPYAEIPLSNFTRRLIQASHSESSTVFSGVNVANFERSRSTVTSPAKERWESTPSSPNRHNASPSRTGDVSRPFTTKRRLLFSGT